MRFFSDEEKKLLGSKCAGFITDCSDIYFIFNSPSDCNEEEEFPLDALIDYITKYEEREKKGKETGNTDWKGGAQYDIPQVAFALGYTLGLSFETEFPEIKKKIENIRSLIRKKHLLLYYPREKKAA